MTEMNCCKQKRPSLTTPAACQHRFGGKSDFFKNTNKNELKGFKTLQHYSRRHVLYGLIEDRERIQQQDRS